MPRPLAPCGTRSAYLRHLRDRKKDPTVVVDEACHQAGLDYANEQRRNSQKQKARHLMLTRTYSAALVELSKLHPNEFRTILARLRRVESNLSAVQESNE